MEKKFKVITLCGSAKFKNAFNVAAKELTTRGNIVLMPYCYSHADGVELDDETKKLMVEMHYQMIDMSDEVMVINVDGYIGKSTKDEIKYADDRGITISYYMKRVD